MISLDGGRDEISLTQQFINLFLLMGGMFVVCYALLYGAFWMGVSRANRLLPLGLFIN